MKQPFAHLKWDRDRAPKTKPATLKQIATILPKQALDPNQPSVNSLIQGENLSVMQTLLPEYREQFDLIYADPPFLSGKTYSARVGHGEDSRKPEDWITTEAYEDTWHNGADYLNMLFPRLQSIFNLLSPTGTLYLHLDWHASAYARVLLDELFGPERLLNEIVWCYHGPSPIKSAFKRKHDTILVYTKSTDYTFNADAVRIPYNQTTIKTFKSSSKAGFGKTPDLARGKVPEDWWYFPVVARLHNERTGYPTQKPEALVERIIMASSNPGDLVGDFFCGSGTIPIVAERLSRKWIGCDVKPIAIQTSWRRLLLESENVTFSVWLDPSREDSKALLEPIIHLEQNQKSLEVSVESVLDSQSGDTIQLEDIVLIEVDWDHDGKIFRSNSREVRALRNGHLTGRLTHHYTEPLATDIAVRVSDSYGRFGYCIEGVSIK